MSENVGVIGGGSWGTTLAKIAGENGCHVALWARREELCAEINESHRNSQYLPNIELPPEVHAVADVRRVCETCRLIIMAVPSHGFRAIAATMGPALDGEHVLVHATKGIEERTFKRMSEILREETAVRRIGVLAGPNLAMELALRQPAGTLISSRYDEVFRRAKAALHNDYFRVYSGHDVVGAEVGAVFKNVVAVAAGIADGLKMGDNTKALLMTRGLNEMGRLGLAIGAKAITFGGMAGIGDLMATCASPYSRNHRVGVRLAEGASLKEILEELKMVAEGVKASRAIHHFADQHGLTLPIAEAVYRIAFEGMAIAEVMRDLMSIRTGDEFAGLPL